MPLFTVFRKASKPVQNLKNYSAAVGMVLPPADEIRDLSDTAATYTKSRLGYIG
jgi:hypothetical protein